MLPEPERDWKRIDVEPAPPCSLVTRAMQLAMMDSADRHDELVAHAASERAGLCKGQVMRIGGHAAAHKARLPQHEFPVVLIAQANRFTQSMDHVAAGLLLGPPRSLCRASGPLTAVHLDPRQLRRSCGKTSVSLRGSGPSGLPLSPIVESLA